MKLGKAFKKEEIPVGAVIVKDGKIIARAHNSKETSKNACGHAEILAIQKACKKLNSWRLLDCDMYVTLEPCPMCAGALINSRISKVYIGTEDEKTVRRNLREQLRRHKLTLNTDASEEEILAHYETLSPEDQGKDWLPFNSMLKLLRKYDGLRIYRLDRE